MEQVKTQGDLSFLVALYIVVQRTKIGKAMRAAAFDQEAALARGISVRRVFAWSWGIAGGVAALAGISLGSGAAALTPSMGLIALAAFPVMILGGLDSPKGAVIAGLLIGITQSLTGLYQPKYAEFLGNNFYSAMPYVVMIAILLVRAGIAHFNREELLGRSDYAIIGELINGKLTLKDVHRFANGGVRACSSLYWDILGLWREIKNGLRIAHQQGPIDSVGIDTWGVDYALLDECGELVCNPYCYRDSRLDGVMERVCNQVGRDVVPG